MQHGAQLLPPPPPSAASQAPGPGLRQRRSIFASAEMAGAGSGARLLETQCYIQPSCELP